MAEDPYLWLEDITGDDALDWVRKHNEPTLAEFGGTRFEQMRTEALEVLDTEARIPYVRRRGDYLYNFWRDAANPRGLWRRTTLDSYRTDEPDWDVMIDVDALATPRTRTGCGPAPTSSNPTIPGPDRAVPGRRRRHGRARIRHGDSGNSSPTASRCRRPSPSITWQDRDTVLVGTEFGPGSLTDSGYPRSSSGGGAANHSPTPRRCSRVSFRRQRCGSGYDPTPGFERLLHHTVVRLLQPRPLRTARRRIDPDRGAHRRRHVGTPRMVADPAADRVDRRRGQLPGGLTAGRQL